MQNYNQEGSKNNKKTKDKKFQFPLKSPLRDTLRTSGKDAQREVTKRSQPPHCRGTMVLTGLTTADVKACLFIYCCGDISFHPKPLPLTLA